MYKITFVHFHSIEGKVVEGKTTHLVKERTEAITKFYVIKWLQMPQNNESCFRILTNMDKII